MTIFTLTKRVGMNISTGSRADIEAIAGFQVAMARESEGTELDPEVVRSGVAAAMEDQAKGSYIVAKEGTEAIGSLMLTREWSDWNNRWYWWIQSVYVVPEWRGRGVFRAMYAAVQQMAAESGVAQVRLYVDKGDTTAQHAYQRVGMEECHYLMYEAAVEP